MLPTDDVVNIYPMFVSIHVMGNPYPENMVTTRQQCEGPKIANIGAAEELTCISYGRSSKPLCKSFLDLA